VQIVTERALPDGVAEMGRMEHMGHEGVPSWNVLLIGGPSGVGKSTVAASLARQLGIFWIQVDDLRLALQFSGLVARERHPELFSFLQPEDWQGTPEEYRDRLIAVGRVIVGALRIVVESHIHHDADAIVIEGDGILPGFAASVAEAFGSEVVRAVFIVAHDAEVLLANMLRRGRGIEQIGPEERQTEARGKALFSRWIEQEAAARDMPVLAPTPWASLTERIASSIAAPPRGR